MFCSISGVPNYYSIPREVVLKKCGCSSPPSSTDTESDIQIPDREPLLAGWDMNRTNEPELVARLKESGSYLSVRMPDGQADRLFNSLLFRRERRSDAGIVYNKYFFKQQDSQIISRKTAWMPSCW